MPKLRKLLMAGLALFALLIVSGVSYERIGERRDRTELRQVGRSYDVGARSPNLYCSGTGSPTVIFEANGGIPGFRWVRLQRDVAQFTRACWYDRAGLGWSDPGPFPNHSDSVAARSARAAGSCQDRSPYILVGHALGGINGRRTRHRPERT